MILVSVGVKARAGLNDVPLQHIDGAFKALAVTQAVNRLDRLQGALGNHQMLVCCKIVADCNGMICGGVARQANHVRRRVGQVIDGVDRRFKCIGQIVGTRRRA